MKRNVALIGASGLCGSAALAALLADGRTGKVLSLARRPSGISHPALREKILPFRAPAAEIEGALASEEIHVGLCALGTTLKQAGSKEAFRRIDVEIPIAFLRALRSAGATRYAFVSAMGTSKSSLFFYSRCKAEIEEAARAAGFESLHVLRPGLLIGERKEARPGESLAIRLAPALDALMIGPAREGRSVPAASVGRRLAACAFSEDTGERILTWSELRTS